VAADGTVARETFGACRTGSLALAQRGQETAPDGKKTMKYYKAINPISKLPKNTLCFNETKNIDDSEMLKINYDADFRFDDIIKISVDKDPKIKEYKEFDFNLSNSGIQIVSEYFKDIIGDNDITFFEIETINYKTKRKYYVMKINKFYDCVDEAKSEIRYWTKENTNIKERVGKYENLMKFVIDDNKVGEAKIFRLKKYFPAIIIRDDLREKIIKNKITGIDFIDTWELK
jgi:hypothetical protein